MELYSDLGADQIPEKPGIYAFFACMITPSIFGQEGQMSESIPSETSESARRILVKRYKELQGALYDREYFGSMRSPEIAGHIAPPIDLFGKDKPPKGVSERLQSIPNEDLYGFVLLLQSATIYSRPLYVGITKEQTLKDRYYQHKESYQAKTEGFGGRLRDAKIPWDTVRFCCSSFEYTDISYSSLGIAEDIVQSLSRPFLSKR